MWTACSEYGRCVADRATASGTYSVTMRPLRRLAACAAAGLLALVAGCSSAQEVVDGAAEAAQQQARAVTIDAAVAAVSDAVQRAASAAGLVVEGAPSCRPDLEVDVVEVVADGTVACTGRTTGGTAYTATFDGRLSTDSCVGSLTIEVDGRAPVVVPEVDGCRLVAVVGGALVGAQS